MSLFRYFKPLETQEEKDAQVARQHTAQEVLMGAAKADAAVSRLAPTQEVPLTAAEVCPAKKKRQYNNWFRPPFGFLILSNCHSCSC